MRRTLISVLPATAMAGAFLGAFVTTPTAAQESSGEKVNQVIVYGDDPCPTSSGDEITVCARKDEGERYRIPEPLRGVDSPKAEAWNNKVQAYETAGAFGTLSCSPVGAGGATGCTQQLINAAYAERKNASDIKFSEMIAAEREKRLSTIDQKAATEQAQVEEAESEYFAKQKAQQATPPSKGN